MKVSIIQKPQNRKSKPITMKRRFTSHSDRQNILPYPPCKKAEIKGLRFHDLRHTFASRALEAGANIVAVSIIIGNADLKTKMRYVHPDDTLKDAASKVQNSTKGRSNSRSNEKQEKTIWLLIL